MVNDKKLVDLERIVQKQEKIINGLVKRVTLLERENARRRAEITTLGNKQ